MARDMAMAFCFGSAPEIAAFMVAYRLANLFRRLLGEGNLQAGFIPHFESAKAESMEKAVLFYRDVSFSLGLVLLGVIAALEGALWALGWFAGEDWKEIIELAMWMAPGLFFICLYALNSSLLQCQKKYFLPAAAPLAFNFIWILSVILIWNFPRDAAVRWLSISVTFAFAAQWAATAVEEKRLLGQYLTLREWLRPHLFSPQWKSLLKPLSLGIVGIGAVQLNSAFDAIFSRLADPSGPAFLWYAIRVEQLPLALFGIALSGAFLPPLSRAMKQGNLGKYRELLQAALRHSAALMLPCAFGIFALGGAGINLLYGHGDFSPADVKETVLCLWGYGIGLIPSVVVLLLANGFYAQKSYRIPTLASVASVAANAGLNALFVFGFGWGAVSIAIATSASALLNALLLTRGLKEKIGPVFQADFWRFFFRMAACCALPATVAMRIGEFWIGPEYPRGFWVQLVQFSGLAVIYGGGVALLAWRLKVREILDLLRGGAIKQEGA